MFQQRKSRVHVEGPWLDCQRVVLLDILYFSTVNPMRITYLSSPMGWTDFDIPRFELYLGKLTIHQFAYCCSFLVPQGEYNASDKD